MEKLAHIAIIRMEDNVVIDHMKTCHNETNNDFKFPVEIYSDKYENKEEGYGANVDDSNTKAVNNGNKNWKGERNNDRNVNQVFNRVGKTFPSK